MQIVIDIPEEDYNNIEPFLNGETIKGGFNLFKALEIIKNGKPLPKGHGRIVDESKITKCEKVGIIIKDGSVIPCITTNAPTLIERSR